MKKVSRSFVKAAVFYEYGSAACRYVHIEEHNGNYYAVDNGGLIYASGKELKGYIGDIIYFQYDGAKYGTGNYYLKSDRHGIICKWKGE